MKRPICLIFIISLLAPNIGFADKASSRPSSQPTSKPLKLDLSPSTQPTALSSTKKRLDKLEKLLNAQNEKIELLQQELEATHDLNSTIQKESSFNIYGFMDVNFYYLYVPNVPMTSVLPTEPSFVFGNLNIYFDFKPDDDWRVLTEIRFLTSPIADVDTIENDINDVDFSREDVTTNDPLNYGANFTLGSVRIERAQIEWNRYPLLNIRAGLFLTPFGIWNVDHGSPVRLHVQPPYLYTNRRDYDSKFPAQQLGIMFYGQTLVGNLNFNYAFTLSNGRGPASVLVDYDKDKAIGARFKLSHSGNVNWHIGVSAYTSLYQDFKLKLQLSPSPDILSETTIRFRETALGIDGRINWGDFGALGELIGTWRFFDDKYRPILSGQDGGTGGYAPDHLSWGGYGLFYWRVPINAIRLRLGVQLGYSDRNDTEPRDNMVESAGIINWAITERVFLKLEYRYMYWLNIEEEERNITYPGNLQVLQTQLAVAF